MLRITGVVLICVCGFCANKTSAQGLNLSDALGLDSARISGTWDSWSVRLFSAYKALNFGFTNLTTDGRVRLVPNNRYSAGLGITYKFISADFGFTIPTDAEQTNRFDGSVTLALGQNVIEMGYQRYKGLSVNGRGDFELPFRHDMISQLYGFNFIRNESGRRLSLNLLVAGLQVQKKSTGVWSYGGYLFWDKLKADSTVISPHLIEYFPDLYGLRIVSQVNIGGLGGYTYSLVLPHNTFLFAAVAPGLGVNFAGTKDFENDIPFMNPSARLVTRLAAGYTGPRVYVVLSANMDVNVALWGSSELYSYSHGRIKLSVGYRFRSEIAFLERMADGIRNAARHASF